MTKKTQIVVVTTALFLTENFIQYNISKKESGENKDKFFVFPPLKNFNQNGYYYWSNSFAIIIDNRRD